MKQIKEWFNVILFPIGMLIGGICWHDIKTTMQLNVADLKQNITDNFVSKSVFETEVNRQMANEAKQWVAVQDASRAAASVATLTAKSQADVDLQMQHLTDLMEVNNKQNK